MATKTIDNITDQHRDIIVPNRGFEIIDRSYISGSVGGVSVPTLVECAWVNDRYASEMRQAYTFEPALDKVIAKSRSAHEVGFGRLTKRNQGKQTGVQHLLSVAVKPFNDMTPAVNEVYGAMRLEELGVETYSPIGIFPTKAGGIAVVTHKRDDLMGLDRDTWIVGRRVENEDDAESAERNTRTVQDIATMFAWLHSNGIFHPDGQLKNWGVTPEGTIGTFDAERHVKIMPGEDAGAPALAWNDIDKFIASLVSNSKEGSIYGVGMLHGLSPGQMQRSIEELFLTPYEDSLVRIAITHDDLSDRAGILMDYIGERCRTAMKLENWPQVYDHNQD